MCKKGRVFGFVAIVAGMICAVPAFAGVAGEATKPAVKLSNKQIERGRYLVKIAGCNDCHTAGYLMKEGQVPEGQWLTGDTLGWRGPWGTTYAPNLRLFMQKLSQDQWVNVARLMRARPPMPWYAVNGMTESDLRAVYAVIRNLGPGGGPAPAYLPPDREPKPPYAQFYLPPQ